MLSYNEAVAKAAVLAERAKIIEQAERELNGLKCAENLDFNVVFRYTTTKLALKIIGHGAVDSEGDFHPNETTLPARLAHARQLGAETELGQLLFEALVQRREDELATMKLEYAAELS